MTRPDPAPPPDCAAALDRLNRRLDGGPEPWPVDVRAHLDACLDCRERFQLAERLAAAFAPPEPAGLSTFWTESVIADVLRDGHRRRRRRLLMTAGALAASLIAAVWLLRPPPAPRPTSPDGADATTVAKADGRPTPRLRDEFAEAGSALAALSRRTAAETVGQGRVLLPTTLEVKPLAFDPPARRLDGARQSLAEGFEPVTTSARRAVTMFWRDLPDLKN